MIKNPKQIIFAFILISITVFANETPALSSLDYFSSTYLGLTDLNSYQCDSSKFPDVQKCFCSDSYSRYSTQTDCDSEVSGKTFHCNECSEACTCSPGTVNVWMYYIFGAIAMFTTLLAIIAFLCYKQMKEQPGDIILGISVSDFFLSLNFVLNAIANTDRQINPYGSICKIYGIAYTFTEITSFSYNICFCLFIRVAVKNSLRSAKIPRLAFHFASIILGIGYTSVSLFTGHIGMSLFGICSTFSSQAMYVSLAVPMIFVILAVFTFITVRRYSGECKRVSNGKKEFLSYYSRYMTTSSLVYLSIAISYLLIATMLSQYSTDTSAQLPSWPLLKAFYALSKISSTFLLSIVRLTDPFMRPHIRKIFGLSAGNTQTINSNSILAILTLE